MFNCALQQTGLPNTYVGDGLLYLHVLSVAGEGFKEFGPFY